MMGFITFLKIIDESYVEIGKCKYIVNKETFKKGYSRFKVSGIISNQKVI